MFVLKMSLCFISSCSKLTANNCCLWHCFLVYAYILRIVVALWTCFCFYYVHSICAAAICLTLLYQNIKNNILIQYMFFLEFCVLFGKFVKVIFFISLRCFRFPVSNLIQRVLYLKTWVSSTKILLCIFPLFSRSLVSPTCTVCCTKGVQWLFCL
jgi:hypothetical protein